MKSLHQQIKVQTWSQSQDKIGDRVSGLAYGQAQVIVHRQVENCVRIQIGDQVWFFVLRKLREMK